MASVSGKTIRILASIQLVVYHCVSQTRCEAVLFSTAREHAVGIIADADGVEDEVVMAEVTFLRFRRPFQTRLVCWSIRIVGRVEVRVTATDSR